MPDTHSALYVIRVTVNSPKYNPLRQTSNSTQAVTYQTHQSNPLYRGYQKTNKKEVYQVEKDLIKDQPKGFYTIFEDKSNNLTYSDKGFNKIAVNFVATETLCTKCCATFPSRLKLYNHWKTGYLGMSLFSFSR